MNILGISAFMHDASACLLQDGKLIAAIEEERLTRIKHAPNTFPNKAIQFCLEKANIKLTDIDHIAYFFNQSLIIKKFWKFQPYFNILKTKPHKFLGTLYLLKNTDKEVTNLAKKANAKVHFIEHHLAHAASAYYGSKFEKANILTLDARGELISTLMATGVDGEIKKLNEIALPHSLGQLYTSITHFLGFSPNDGEGKVMGLAPYGKDKFKKHFDKMIWKTKNGFKSLPNYYWGHVEEMGSKDKTFYTKDTIDLLGKPRTTEHPINNHYEHIAASLQNKLEEIGIHLTELMYKQTGCKNVCLAGGVALNSKMNGEIYKQQYVDDIYIQPLANDAGTSIGAALYLYNQLTGKRPEPIDHVYLGQEYTNEEIKKILDKCKVKYEYIEDIEGEVAEKLSKNKIVGWFQGRTELGPRALGNRSILVNPKQEKMKDILNYYVKNRELWRPFALSMLHEARKKYLTHGWVSPFMILIDEAPIDVISEIAAGVHVDGTTRPQTVEKSINPKYYKLIKEFGKITGTPVILNTSFNLAGEPIVNKPEEALMDFYGSGMDHLALGNYLLTKK